MANLDNLEGRSDEERRAKLRRKKTHKHNQRPTTPKGMRMTPRDLEVIRMVYEYRILSQKQLERLLGRSRGTVQERLIRLYHHHFLDRVFFPIVIEQGRSPALYVLDKNGIELLREQGIEDFTGRSAKKLTGLFIHHTMALNDVRIAVTLATRALGWTIERWIDENTIKADYDKISLRLGGARPEIISIIPDSYFVIGIPGKGISNFFVEVDRGTETRQKFRQKVAGYVAYYKTGMFEKRFNASGFRVLTIVAPTKLTDATAPTRGVIRLANLKTEAETIQGIGKRFWFALQSDLEISDILKDPVWSITGSTENVALFTA